MLTTPVIRESSLKPFVPFLLNFVMDRFVIVEKIEEFGGVSLNAANVPMLYVIYGRCSPSSSRHPSA